MSRPEGHECQTSPGSSAVACQHINQLEVEKDRHRSDIAESIAKWRAKRIAKAHSPGKVKLNFLQNELEFCPSGCDAGSLVADLTEAKNSAKSD